MQYRQGNIKNRIHRISLINVFLIIAMFSMLCSQEKLSLTVDQAIAIGVQNSKSLHSSLMKSEYADAKSGEVHTQGLPQIKFSGSYTKLSNVPPEEIGPYPPLFNDKILISPSIFNYYDLRLSLQQPLFTGFRIQSASDIAEYTAQATSQDFSNDKSELVYNIQTSYWNLYKANEFKKVIDENVMQMNAHLKEVQNMFDQGILTKNEVLKVEVQLSNAQVVQLDAQNNVHLAMLALNNIIGTPLRSDIEIDTSNIIQPEDYGDVNRLVQEAMENRSDVKSMEYRVKAGESGVTLARSGWFPQIYLLGNYYYDRPNQRIFPAVDQFQDTWDVSLSVSFDIWNWGNTIHQTNQAQAQLAEMQDALGQLRDGVTLEVTQNYLNANEANERTTVAEKGVNQAEENYRITHEKFKSGLALNTDLLDAEAALLQSKWSHIQAVVDRMLAVARLKKSIGGDLTSR